MLAFKTILHPTDFSATSDMAFRMALSLARDHGGRVIVLHVAIQPAPYVVDEVVVPPLVQDLEPLRKRLREMAASHPRVPIETRMVEGDAAKEILRIAASEQCDLIVLGSHGRHGLSRLIMGSVAEQVIRRARCSVVVAKAPPLEADDGDDIIGLDHADSSTT